MRIPALVQHVLLLAQFFTALKKYWVHIKRAVFGRAKRVSVLSLCSCSIPNCAVDTLEFKHSFRLLEFHAKIWKQGFACQCRELRTYGPNKLRAMLWPTGMASVSEIAAEYLLEQLYCRWFAHLHGDRSCECSSAGSAANSDAAFAIDNTSQVGQYERVRSEHVFPVFGFASCLFVFFSFRQGLIAFTSGAHDLYFSLKSVVTPVPGVPA